MQTAVDDPETALRKRIKNQLQTAAGADPIGFGSDLPPTDGTGDKGVVAPAPFLGSVGSPTAPQQTIGPTTMPVGGPITPNWMNPTSGQTGYLGEPGATYQPGKPWPVLTPQTGLPTMPSAPDPMGKPVSPSAPYTGPDMITNVARDGGDGSYTPPDPPPYLPAPAAPAPAAPPVVRAPNDPPARVDPTGTVNAGTTPAVPQTALTPMPGFDAGKLQDPAHTTTKYEVARILQKYPATVAGLQAAMAEIQAKYPGAALSGNDTLTGLPGTQGPVDVLQNASTGGSNWWWGDTGASGGAGGGGGATALTNTGGGAGTVAGATAGANTPDWYNQIRQMLLDRIAASQTPVNQNDEYIAGPLSAARDETTRSQDLERKMLAERAYAQGDLNSGVVGQQIQLSSERNATGLSQLRAGLISKEYTARRDELQNYLQLAMASGDAEMARNIQLQIAQLNAAVERERMGLSLAEYLAQLNQNTANAGAGR